MDNDLSIQYIQRDKIDIEKWDRCISHSPNGLIYAYAYYLDHMTKHWSALVLNDYEVVMPLTWNRKFGISYLYQPFITAQLGIFGPTISVQLVEAFLNAIPKSFLFWDIYLNHQNVFPLQNFPLYQRKNYVLDLAKTYQELYRNYRENIQRNIKKAEQLGCKVVKGFDVKQVVALAKEQMRTYSKESADNIERFSGLYDYLEKRGQATTYGVHSNNNELIASAVFFFSHDRAYYILVGNHPNGRTIGASHMLIDAFIKDHAEKKMMLDFEGSDIRNLAFFYSSFGAVEENYATIKLNKLPFFLKWLKK
ncbi:GNAT family N-acetyltransferase [Terrimonas pollutisoli]|uniref:GNAT family N-acetyltransferase n=1 Tax=Terrimonas pollutisoli TaxID=3034147 RepID=UPI0023ECBE51|nr:GNAT family N-acetyltransferase [Terrimonas sp. H1YJ31]